MQSQELPPKDLSLFRQLVKFYESKQYKKGIKTADFILKKHPQHGETICMKGLLLNGLEKREEAYQLARQGLKYNLKSHVCWHVLGLIYRSDRNYVESSKCYKSALRMDPGNAQIMRDLALLQLHERDVAGYAETRRQLLVAKAAQKPNWLSYAIAEHIRGAPESALSVLTKMNETFANTDEYVTKYEKSELILYTASIMMDAKQFEQGIVFLTENDSEIVDRVSKLEYLVYLTYSSGRFEDTKLAVDKLLSFNNSHEGYILCLFAASGLVENITADQVAQWLRLGESSFLTNRDWRLHARETVKIGKRSIKVSKESNGIVLRDSTTRKDASQIITLLDQIKEQVVKCDSFDLLSLFVLPAESSEFKAHLEKYLETKINKGVPSAFKLVRDLYIQSMEKGRIIEEVLTSFMDRTRETDSPVFKTFAIFALCHHYDFVGDYQQGLTLIETAIKLTPTLVDLYVLKSKLFKHSGNLISASESIEFARSLDGADRYLNSKATKGFLRIGEIEKARKTVMMFAKDSVSKEDSNLKDMQCMWWEYELGKALARKGDWNGALNIWNDTRSHYLDMADDEFDFNSYCVRKMTIRAYLDFLKLHDRLTGHRYYRRIAKEFVITLLGMFSGSIKQTAKNLTAHWKIHKKPATAGSAKKDDDENDNTPIAKADVAPVDWFRDKDALNEAGLIIAELKRKSAEWKGTYKLSFEVNLVKKAFLECVRDLTKLKSLGSSKLKDLLNRLVNAISSESKDSVANYETIQNEISALS